MVKDKEVKGTEDDMVEDTDMDNIEVFTLAILNELDSFRRNEDEFELEFSIKITRGKVKRLDIKKKRKFIDI